MKTGVRASWERALLVCGKCQRKLGGGFGPDGDLPLVKALRREPGCGKGRKARTGVLETKCLGICPKKAAVVVDTAEPGLWRLVRPGDDLTPVLRKPPAEAACAVNGTAIVVEEAQAST